MKLSSLEIMFCHWLGQGNMCEQSGERDRKYLNISLKDSPSLQTRPTTQRPVSKI